eukprot:COSAG01_NODE_1830_length_9121_cov_96.924074_6_plen_33_part_00
MPLTVQSYEYRYEVRPECFYLVPYEYEYRYEY